MGTDGSSTSYAVLGIVTDSLSWTFFQRSLKKTIGSAWGRTQECYFSQSFEMDLPKAFSRGEVLRKKQQDFRTNMSMKLYSQVFIQKRF